MIGDTLALAVVQFSPSDDKGDNLRRIGDLAERAAEEGARFVVFPEYSLYFTNPLDETFADAAETMDGPFVAGLKQVARGLSIHLVVGIVEEVAGDTTRFSNTLVAINPGGDIVATYRKLHLYDAFGQRESDWVVPGQITDPQTFTAGGLTVGLQTCYDLRFPEVSRRLVDAGADLIVVPAEWVAGQDKVHAWRTLMAARAIENTAYFAAADHPPPIGVGNSVIVDPMGLTIAEIDDGEDVYALAAIDPARVAAVRERNPALALRRFGTVAL